jgi:CO/xanthine dehydrogenase FAD-binding subunit
MVAVADDGTIEEARIVLGGVAPAPIEVADAAAALVGEPFTEQNIEAAAEACYLKARPLDNTDFVMGWRKQMARPFANRALVELRMAR